jgi:hypothetical protein
MDTQLLLLGALLAVLLVSLLVVASLVWGAVRTKKAPNYDSEDYFVGPDGYDTSC